MRPLPLPKGANPDDVLMRRVAARDGAAFRLLVDRHAACPHRIAWRMLGDRTEAEDVTQEAMLRLWNAAPRWREGDSGVAAWLTRVATNLCLDRLRARARLSDDPVPELPDPALAADAAIIVQQGQARVLRALARLSERQRAALVLTYYEELPNAAAAGVLEMNLKAFESLLLRARAAMRVLLDLPDDD